MMIHQRKWSQIKFWTFQRPPHVSYQNSQTKYRSNLFYNLIQSELLPLRLNYSECKTKIFWCVPGFLLEFVLLNLLLFCVPGSEETTTDCIYIVIFFFAKCDLASVTLFTRLPTSVLKSCDTKVYNYAAENSWSFASFASFFKSLLRLRRSSGVLKVCLNS